MPMFNTLSVSEPRQKPGSDHCAMIMSRTPGNLKRVAPCGAGKFKAGEGEMTQVVRLRRNAAAEAYEERLNSRCVICR